MTPGLGQEACQVGGRQGPLHAGVAGQCHHSMEQEHTAEGSHADRHRTSAENRVVVAGSARHSAARIEYSSPGISMAPAWTFCCSSGVDNLRYDIGSLGSCRSLLRQKQDWSTDCSLRVVGQQVPVARLDGTGVGDPSPAYHVVLRAPRVACKLQFNGVKGPSSG